MALNTLTETAIRGAVKTARTAGRPVKLADGGGLRLDVQPGGAGWWRWRFRFDGAERMLSLGTYPAVGLADARQRRDEARRLLAAGTDPSAMRKAEKVERAEAAEREACAAAGEALPGSFEAVAREWLATVHEGKVSAGHAERTLLRFEQDAFPFIGARPLAEIEAPELLAMLRRVSERGAVETAHRLRGACAQVFRFGIASGYCARNPAADLAEALPPVLSRHYAAVTDPAEAGDMLRVLAGYKGHPVTRCALALSALLMLRPGELRQLEWAWIDFDAATLTVPAALMKRKKHEKTNGAPHLVPLAPQALSIFRDELHPLTGAGRYCFPSLRSGDRPMSENTVNAALRRLGFDSDTATAHGFRAMARTLAAERLGIAPEVIEAQLAHAVPDALGRAYNRTTWAEQRREMMTKWADYLDRLRDGAQIVAMPARAA